MTAPQRISYVSRRWWVLLVTGVASIVAGGIIVLADWTVDDPRLVHRCPSGVSGGLDALQRARRRVRTEPVFGHGVIELGVGIAVWVWPGPTLLVIEAFIGWLLPFRGTTAIVGSINGRHFIPYWGVILAGGIAEVVVSFYLLSRPGLTLLAADLAIGLVSMALGVLQIILAFEVKNLPEHFDDLARQIDDSATPAGLRLREQPDGARGQPGLVSTTDCRPAHLADRLVLVVTAGLGHHTHAVKPGASPRPRRALVLGPVSSHDWRSRRARRTPQRTSGVWRDRPPCRSTRSARAVEPNQGSQHRQRRRRRHDGGPRARGGTPSPRHPRRG